jgi:hypothetical protein
MGLPNDLAQQQALEDNLEQRKFEDRKMPQNPRQSCTSFVGCGFVIRNSNLISNHQFAKSNLYKDLKVEFYR